MAQITAQGILLERLDENINKFSEAFKSIYGSNINIDPDSPDGQMIGLLAQIKMDFEELLGNVYKQLDPEYASGKWLEQRVAYAGLTRRDAKYSYLRSVILTGDPYVNIYSGLEVTDDSNNKWVLLEDVQLSAEGSARADFRSAEYGAYSLIKGNKLKSTLVVLGLDSLTVSESSQAGENEETDAELRARFFLSRSKNAINSVEAIKAKLLQLRDVKQVCILENTSNKVDSDSVPGHSINVIIHGGNDNEIAEIIYENKGAGVGLYGSKTVNLERENHTQVIKIDRPRIVDIHVKMVVVRNKNFTDIDKEAIKEELGRMQFSIGQDVAVSRLYCPINSVSGFWVQTLQIGKSKSNVSANNIEIGKREIARIQSQNVTVEVR